jgi:hypothetical protein
VTLSRGHRVPIDRCLPSIYTIIVKASERRTVNGQCEVRGNEQRIRESTLNLQHALTLLSVQQTGERRCSSMWVVPPISFHLVDRVTPPCQASP